MENFTAAEEIEEDSWDAIDIDARIQDDCKAKQQDELERMKLLEISQKKKAAEGLKAKERDRKVEANRKKQEERIKDVERKKTALAEGVQFEDDGNYFDLNARKKAQASSAGRSQKSSRDAHHTDEDDDYQQPYPSKDLYDIQSYTKSSENFHKMIYMTYGNLERFLVTHDAPNLIPKKLVELLNIDVALLEVPFSDHNELFLGEIAKVATYWSQVIDFLHEFLERKYKDLKFLLNVDMDGFFRNLEHIFHNLMLNNHFNDKMEKVLKKLTTIIEKFDGHEWMVAHGFSAVRFRDLQTAYEKNVNLHKVYDVSMHFVDRQELMSDFFRFIQLWRSCRPK